MSSLLSEIALSIVFFNSNFLSRDVDKINRGHYLCGGGAGVFGWCRNVKLKGENRIRKRSGPFGTLKREIYQVMRVLGLTQILLQSDKMVGSIPDPLRPHRDPCSIVLRVNPLKR